MSLIKTVGSEEAKEADLTACIGNTLSGKKFQNNRKARVH